MKEQIDKQIAENREDVSQIKNYVDYDRNPPEWGTKISTTGYLSALFIMNNDFSIMIYLPEAIAPEAIKKRIGGITMNTITTTLTTEAVFSDDNRKRYLLKKTWNTDLPKMTILMLAPSEAAGIELDTTTQLVLNNASRLGFGSVAIVNLFATLNDFALKQVEAEDPDNLQAIVEAAQTADLIVYR